jgi:hypothetical protein
MHDLGVVAPPPEHLGVDPRGAPGWCNHSWWIWRWPWFDGDEVFNVGAVVDAANHGYSKDHEPWLLGSKEGAHIALVGQVELSVGAQDEVGEAQMAELPHDG